LPGIDFTQILIQFAIIILSLSVHEAAHAWSALRLGDHTARLLGRVSLNPAVHVDPIGTILFPLIAMITGAPLLGWAKPVPVNTHQLGPHWQRKFMAIAAAGPGSNLILAAIGAIALRLALGPFGQPPTAPVIDVLVSVVELNVLLAVFNMVPLPPLDGGNVLAGLLRGNLATMFENIRPYGFMILYGLMFTGMLSALIGPPRNGIMRVLAAIVNG
jgi:Zn-dependent protease